MKFDFVDVFIRSAKITWKYKVLWIFGIFAGCNRSSGGNSNGGGSNYSANNSQNPFTPEMERQLMRFLTDAVEWFEKNPWVIYAFIAFVLISIILQIFLGTIGTTGLIRGVARVEDGATSLPFGELFSESMSYFWRVFGAGFLIWLPLYIFLFGGIILAILPILMSSNSNDPYSVVSFAVILIGLCCCLFPLAIGLGLYNTMVNRALLAEKLPFLEAFKRGWQVLTKNILLILGVGLVLYIIGIIIGVLLMLPILVPTLILFQSLVNNGLTSWQPFINLIIISLCYTPIFWFFNGILTTYTETVWTLSYLGFTHPKEPISGEIIFGEASSPTALDSPPA